MFQFRNLLASDVRPAANDHVAAAYGNLAPRGTVLRLVVPPSIGDRPLLSELSRRYDLDLNLVEAEVNRTAQGSAGTLVVVAVGAAGHVNEAILSLRRAGAQVNVLHRPEDDEAEYRLLAPAGLW